MRKEDIYDEKISPLMAQIIQICHEHKIAMVMSFHLPDAEQDTLHCSTALVAEEFEPSYPLTEAWKVIRGDSNSLFQITVEKATGEKTCTVVLP